MSYLTPSAHHPSNGSQVAWNLFTGRSLLLHPAFAGLSGLSLSRHCPLIGETDSVDLGKKNPLRLTYRQRELRFR